MENEIPWKMTFGRATHRFRKNQHFKCAQFAVGLRQGCDPDIGIPFDVFELRRNETADAEIIRKRNRNGRTFARFTTNVLPSNFSIAPRTRTRSCASALPASATKNANTEAMTIE